MWTTSWCETERSYFLEFRNKTAAYLRLSMEGFLALEKVYQQTFECVNTMCVYPELTPHVMTPASLILSFTIATSQKNPQLTSPCMSWVFCCMPEACTNRLSKNKSDKGGRVCLRKCETRISLWDQFINQSQKWLQAGVPVLHIKTSCLLLMPGGERSSGNLTQF